jgi:NitT/TauT family transport system substrate-binding protein
MFRALLIAAGLVIALAACATPAATTQPAASPAAAASVAADAPGVATTQTEGTPVSVSMGYIPDVQFAPFYVAQQRGYYAAEGLSVTIDHSSIQDALLQVAQGRLTFASATGDEILVARAQQIPIKMVFQTFQQYPIAVFAKAEQGITAPEDLAGKTIGIPGRFGASYVGLLGMLFQAGLSEDDVRLTEIGFTQAAAVEQDRVQAAVGYSNNEPLLLQNSGVEVDVLPVSATIDLVSNGIVASEALIADDPDLVRRFVRATARGLQDTIDDPQTAFTIALTFIPELTADRQPQELEKLKQTIELWRGGPNGLGYSDPAAWQTTYEFLRNSGILESEVAIEQAFTNDLRP